MFGNSYFSPVYFGDTYFGPSVIDYAALKKKRKKKKKGEDFYPGDEDFYKITGRLVETIKEPAKVEFEEITAKKELIEMEKTFLFDEMALILAIYDATY